MDVSDTYITLTLPFQLPFDIPLVHKDKFSSTTTITINKTYLQFLVRLIVLLCTFLLFRPHLARLWRTTMGQTSPEAEEIQQRIQKLEAERQTGGSSSKGAGGKKVIAVAGGSGDSRTEAKSDNTPSGGKGSARRRKA